MVDYNENVCRWVILLAARPIPLPAPFTLFLSQLWPNQIATSIVSYNNNKLAINDIFERDTGRYNLKNL